MERIQGRLHKADSVYGFAVVDGERVAPEIKQACLDTGSTHLVHKQRKIQSGRGRYRSAKNPIDFRARKRRGIADTFLFYSDTMESEDPEGAAPCATTRRTRDGDRRNE